jgi:hypothetical protein
MTGMIEKKPTLEYESTRPRWGHRLIVAGGCIMALGLLMGFAAAIIFVLPTMPSRLVYSLGFVCFWGFFPVILFAVAVAVGRGNYRAAMLATAFRPPLKFMFLPPQRWPLKSRLRQSPEWPLHTFKRHRRPGFPR